MVLIMAKNTWNMVLLVKNRGATAQNVLMPPLNTLAPSVHIVFCTRSLALSTSGMRLRLTPLSMSRTFTPEISNSGLRAA